MTGPERKGREKLQNISCKMTKRLTLLRCRGSNKVDMSVKSFRKRVFESSNGLLATVEVGEDGEIGPQHLVRLADRDGE